jgi:hypothetical protein
MEVMEHTFRLRVHQTKTQAIRLRRELGGDGPAVTRVHDARGLLHEELVGALQDLRDGGFIEGYDLIP